MDIAIQQLRYAIRSIRRTPVMSAVIITTLSISIALVTTFFGFVNTAFYHPLPYPDARRTISLSHWGNVKIEVTELARVTHALQSIATFNDRPAILSFGGSSLAIDATKIDTAFFRILKVGPVLGSLPTPQEIRSNAQIVVIGERLWATRFGGRSDIIGLTVALNGEQRRVIGVMPAWFTFPGSDEAWYPFRINEVAPTDGVEAIGRLADGATLADAQREANLIRGRIRAADAYGAIRWGGLFLSPNMVDRVARFIVAPIVWLLVGGAVCVLLVACTNVAALMLAREARRRSEMMIRASLGASGWQLVRQQLIESIVLAAISGIIAIVLSVWCTQMVLRLLPPAFVASLPGWVHFGLDIRVLGLACGVSMLTVVLFAVWPAREAIRLDLASALRSAADRGVSNGDPTRRLHLPVILQISLSVILLVAAATIVRSAREYGAHRGYSIDGLTELRFTDNPNRDTSRSDLSRLYVRLGERMRDMSRPSIQVATSSIYTGLTDSAPRSEFELRMEGSRRVLDAFVRPGAHRVSDNYFRVLGIPLIAGRAFTGAETPGPPSSVVVSRRFAMDTWGTPDVVGKQLLLGRAGTHVTVVGVAENVNRVGFTTGRATLVEGHELYFSERQSLTSSGWTSFIIRSPLPPSTLSAFASTAAKSLGYDLPAEAVPMTQELRINEMVNHVLAKIIAAFAAISLLLATMGIYGVVAFSVEQRMREIGVRIALGAQGADVVRLLAVSGARLILIGTAIGLVGAAAAGKLVTSIVLASLAGHVTIAFSVAAIFLLVGGIACYLPARRSMRIDAASLLRE